ncbi:MAG: Peptidase rane alanine aminopeptidase [Streptosporangiaceae bacterium]|nr:Peptidase rane alanine aminopeptidase [Streptosporangiaceae bacterium]
MDFLSIAMAAIMALSPASPERTPDRLLPELGNDGYRASAYDLSYDFTPKSRELDGTATMTGTAYKTLATFGMDFAGGTVRSVSVDGRPARFQVKGQKLVVTPSRKPRRGAFQVTVRYTADREAKVPSQVDDTAGWSNSKDGGFSWWGQPDRAHLFFPCNDDLTDKATFTYRVTVPDGWTAVANGTLAARQSTAGHTTFVYSTAHPMATQLAQLAVGRFDIVTGRGPHGLPLRSAVPTGSDTSTVKRLPEYLTWLENKIGRRYPFEVAGVLGVDGPTPEQTFALETQTLPVFPVSGLTDSTEVVHELAHQWFGDSAGVKTWSDIWLSEAFATYLDHMWNAEHGGEPLDKVMHQAYDGDKKARAAGIRPANPGKAEAMFAVGRGAGPVVLYALHQKVGDARYQRIVQAYFDRYRDGSASSAGFVAVANNVGGQDLTTFLNDWLYGAKTPPMPGHPDW